MTPHATDANAPIETTTLSTTAGPTKPGEPDAVVEGKMPEVPSVPTFEDPYEARTYWKGRLAAAFRIFAKNGYDEGITGHITLRDPVEPTSFWVNPFGTAFGLMKASDLVRVSNDGKVLEGGRNRMINTAAFMIHSAIHQARPDVMAACHCHSIHGRAFGALGRKLEALTQESCAFYDDHAVYGSYNGVVLASEEGRNIAHCLGANKAAILQNHGLLTVGKSIDEAVFWFVIMDRCCQIQLLAEAAAGSRGQRAVAIPHDDAVVTHNLVGANYAGHFCAKPLFDEIHHQTGGEYLN